MSKFGTIDRQSEVGSLGAIILDDAHAAFESVRKNFTFSVSAKDHIELYKDLCARFRQDFIRLDRVRTFDDVVSGQEPFVLDVPYWAWLQKEKEVGTAIQSYGAEKVDRWAWSHLRDEFHVCQALISRKAFSIVTVVPLVDRSAAFSRAARRIYMSATISDDSEVIRTFGVPSKSAFTPIIAVSLAGSGERMILSPSLIKSPTPLVDNAIARRVISRALAENKNSAVLTPSFAKATPWADVAEVPATGDQSVALIAKLKSMRGVAAVLPRRYDGIDLPGDECRVLVLDGLPYGESDYDSWRLNTLSVRSSGAVLAQRIEQAIGRGSRGSSDFCVVLLMGADLVTWIGRKNNQASLSASTRRQLEIGLAVSETVSSPQEFIETAWKCLDRDPDWREYHASEMSSAALPMSPDLASLQIAEQERIGIDALRVRSYTSALSAFDQAIDLASDAETKGWFHQLKARGLFQSGDETGSDDKQSKAYGLNRRLTAPIGQITVTLESPSIEQAALLVSRLDQYLHAGVALAHFDRST